MFQKLWIICKKTCLRESILSKLENLCSNFTTTDPSWDVFITIFQIQNTQIFWWTPVTSCLRKQPPEVFYKKCVHRNFVKFTGKPASLLKKRLWHRCFPVNFTNFLGTTFLQNTSGLLLLCLGALPLQNCLMSTGSCSRPFWNIKIFSKTI